MNINEQNLSRSWDTILYTRVYRVYVLMGDSTTNKFQNSLAKYGFHTPKLDLIMNTLDSTRISP